MRRVSPAAAAVPPAAAKTAKIVIVHHIPLMRLGLEAALRANAEIPASQVMGFADFGEAAESFATVQRGDVVLADGAQWAAMEPIVARLKAQGVVFALVASADNVAAQLWAKRGLAGIIAPDARPQDVATAVAALLEGKTAFQLRDAGANEPVSHANFGRLSHRQFEILELMTRGLLNKQIAWQLGLTEGTVKSHVSAILEKLGCDRRTQAIAAFMQTVSTSVPPSLVA